MLSTCGELLEDADGVVGAEDGDGAREADRRGARGDGRERHGGGGDGEVAAVVLADAEDVEPELVGQLGLLEQVLEALLRGDAGGEVREGGDAEFHARQDTAE